jgi:tetratricopeptide (TPR) repeat protein
LTWVRAALSPAVIVVALALGAWITVDRVLGDLDAAFFPASRAGLRGLILYQRGRFTEAARAYRDSLRKKLDASYADDPDGAWAVVVGDLDTAGRWARLTLQLVPSALEPRITLAEIALERGDLATSGRMLDEVLRERPDHLDALYLSALIQARRGDIGAAIERLNRGLVRSGVTASRPLLLWRVLELAGELEALPEPRRPLCLLAHLLRYVRIYDPAHAERIIAHARSAIARGDRPADAWLSIAIVEGRLGRTDAATDAMRTALALDPGHAEAAGWLAHDAWLRFDTLTRYRMVHAAFAARPTDPYFMAYVDEVLVGLLGDHHGVARLMERALAVDPDYLPAHERLAAAALRLGDPERAARHRAAAERLSRRRAAAEAAL